MHPNELRNFALVAAVRAKLDGFPATAEAFLFFAETCAAEATTLQTLPWLVDGKREARPSPS